MKFLICLLVASIGLGGCLALEPTEAILAEMAARRVAFHVGQSNPDLIEPGIRVCNEILAANDTDTATPLLLMAVEVAVAQIDIDDPFIAQDIMSIMKLLGINRESELMKDINLGDLHVIAGAIKVGLGAAR